MSSLILVVIPAIISHNSLINNHSKTGSPEHSMSSLILVIIPYIILYNNSFINNLSKKQEQPDKSMRFLFFS